LREAKTKGGGDDRARGKRAEENGRGERDSGGGGGDDGEGGSAGDGEHEKRERFLTCNLLADGRDL